LWSSVRVDSAKSTILGAKSFLFAPSQYRGRKTSRSPSAHYVFVCFFEIKRHFPHGDPPLEEPFPYNSVFFCPPPDSAVLGDPSAWKKLPPYAFGGLLSQGSNMLLALPPLLRPGNALPACALLA